MTWAAHDAQAPPAQGSPTAQGKDTISRDTVLSWCWPGPGVLAAPQETASGQLWSPWRRGQKRVASGPEACGDLESRGSAPPAGLLHWSMGLVQGTQGMLKGVPQGPKTPDLLPVLVQTVSMHKGSVRYPDGVCSQSGLAGDPTDSGMQAGRGASGPRTRQTRALAHPPAPIWLIPSFTSKSVGCYFSGAEAGSPNLSQGLWPPASSLTGSCSWS